MTRPAPETQIVTEWRVACDGSGPGLGHPRVWYSIPHDRGWVECGYCDKRFVHQEFEGRLPSDKVMGEDEPGDGPKIGDKQPR